jgi:hypothetical protein
VTTVRTPPNRNKKRPFRVMLRGNIDFGSMTRGEIILDQAYFCHARGILQEFVSTSSFWMYGFAGLQASSQSTSVNLEISWPVSFSLNDSRVD